ncbi:MAG: hypothetical protein J5949_09825, partial [Oscillospiraceae bacterium]|nr:hypothetical protein [Oscillospiraceae bacterium]
AKAPLRGYRTALFHAAYSICNPSEQFKGFMCSPRLCDIMKKHAGRPDIMTKLPVERILSFCQASPRFFIIVLDMGYISYCGAF